MLARLLDHPAVIGAFSAAPIVYIGGLALGRRLKRVHRVSLGPMYHLLCAALAIYLPLIAWHFATSTPESRAGTWQDRWLGYFTSALILLGILFALALVRRFLFERWLKRAHDAEAPKLLQQVFSFAAFTVALMLVLNLRHQQQVDTFIAGSGIVAVVLGFAMQETLANIISGIALQVSKPFKVGDWLVVDNTRAEVVEMNWRSTRLRTNDDVYLDLPNKSVTSGMITNLSYPTKAHAHRIRVRFEHREAPNMVRELLRHAAQSVDGVLSHPPVKVFLVDFIDFAALYEIKYYLDEAGRFNDVEDGIRTNVWYEAQRAGLVIPAPVQNLHIHREASAAVPRKIPSMEVLARQPLLAPLTTQQRERLLQNARVQRFGRSEQIIQQGDRGTSMFLLLEGKVAVTACSNGKEVHLADLGPGDAFGEMSLLTDEPRMANVEALTDCQVWELDRSVLSPILKENPDLAHRLSELLAHRRMETEGVLASKSPAHAEEAHKEYTRGFLRRISALFEI